MFGYVTTNMEEMKIKDYRIYHGFYCGVCQDLKEDHGQTSRVTLTYDVTFLGILLTGLYETETKREEHFCAMHPFKKASLSEKPVDCLCGGYECTVELL